MQDSLSRSDFKFEDLKTKSLSIYLAIPADRLQAFAPLLRILVQLAITVNARNIEVQPERPILFILDEMPALGRLPAIEQAYGLMAGYPDELRRMHKSNQLLFIDNMPPVIAKRRRWFEDAILKSKGVNLHK